MVLNPSWPDILLRLLLVVAAGALIGFNRESGGHAAGFRTTILVGLAACLTMIQANILLATSGKSPESFASMDILRFPLGVLTGVGFIGGGAILKRGDLVTGVTTAATLWIVTAIGLCLGGGQLIIGSAGAILAFVVLSLLKWCDRLIPRKQKARVVIELPLGANIAIPEIRMPGRSDCTFSFVAKTIGSTPESANVAFEARWKWAGVDGGGAQLLASLQVQYKIISFEMEKSNA
ncbi:MgtC/SapB family protein [Rhizobium sp. P38BS-XIX]|uniref:MgtC/SapB family protein n=1 Tax=Rhizobium sp. P38BS-XIX TaxID=2726740 RepID=UPI001FEF2ED5|nr:MgtC/SapB family protein [Rhizobium sp. P38BS-XIX]